MRNGSTGDVTLFFIIGAIVGAMFAFAIIKGVGVENHSDIIKAGCGELNPISKKFQFVKIGDTITETKVK